MVSCAQCSKKEGEEGVSGLKKCGRCSNIRYCSSACQTAAWPFHSKTCVRPNYVLHIQLGPNIIRNPPIIRKLSCPATATFEQLHRAIQIAFGWASTHAYDFSILHPDWDAERDSEAAEDTWLQQLLGGGHLGEIGVDGSAPQQCLVRLKSGLGPMQAVDVMHEGRRQHPNATEQLAKKVRLYQWFEGSRRGDIDANGLEYLYDFGDQFCHKIKILHAERPDATDHFACLDGQGTGCAEDCGSMMAWEDLKALYKKRNPTADDRERMKWYEHQASNSTGVGLQDPTSWSRSEVNRDLGLLLVVKGKPGLS